MSTSDLTKQKKDSVNSKVHHLKLSSQRTKKEKKITKTVKIAYMLYGT